MRFLLTLIFCALATSVAGQTTSPKKLPVEIEPGKHRFQIALPFSSADTLEDGNMTQYKWMDGDRTFVVQVIQHKASFFKSRGSAGRFKEAMAPDVGNFLEHSATWSLANDVRVGNLAGREFRYGAKEANGERTGIIRAFLSGTTWYRITASMTSTPTDAKLDLIQGIVNSFVPVR